MKEGHYVARLDFDCGDGPLDNFIDLPLTRWNLCRSGRFGRHAGASRKLAIDLLRPDNSQGSIALPNITMRMPRAAASKETHHQPHRGVRPTIVFSESSTDPTAHHGLRYLNPCSCSSTSRTTPACTTTASGMIGTVLPSVLSMARLVLPQALKAICGTLARVARISSFAGEVSSRNIWRPWL